MSSELLDATQEGLRRRYSPPLFRATGHLGDIGWAVQSYVEQFEVTAVVKEYVGHGVGHEPSRRSRSAQLSARPGHGTAPGARYGHSPSNP